MQTDDVRSQPGNNFSVLRVSRELPSRSGIGAMFVNRTATGSLARSNDWNRTFGADARLGVGELLHGRRGFAARTETPGLTGRDYAYNVDSEWDDGRHRVGIRVRRDRRGLQPRGRLPRERGRLSPVPGPLRGDAAPGEGAALGFPRVPAALHLHPLQLPRRRPAERRAPRRQPLGLGERQLRQRRAQRHVGRAARAVPGLSRHRRAAGRARRPADVRAREHRSPEGDLGALGVGRWAAS